MYYIPIDMKDKIEELVELCKQINDSWHNNENRDGWKNLRLVPEVATQLTAMPLEGETSAANQIDVLSLMIDCVDELAIPRQILSIRKYQLSLFEHLEPEAELQVTREEVEQEIQRLEDYVNLSIPMEEWCKKYHKHLLFDPVERTLEYETIIYEVEEEVATELKDEPRCMGFCFAYWAALRTAFAKRGIEWRSPGQMNPRVHFD